MIVAGTAIGLFAVILFSGLGNGVQGYVNKQVNDMVNPRSVIVTQYVKGSDASGGSDSGASQQSMMAELSKGAATFKQSDVQKIKDLSDVTAVQKIYTNFNQLEQLQHQFFH